MRLRVLRAANFISNKNRGLWEKKTTQEGHFLKKIAGGENEVASQATPTQQIDKLFEKYARKSIGKRYYSEDQTNPANPDEPSNRRVPVTSSLVPYSGAWTYAEIAHLLRRVGFGAQKTALDNYLTMTPAATVDDLLTIGSFTPAAPGAVPLNNYQGSYVDSSGVALGANWTGSNLTFGSTSNDGSVEYQRQLSLTAWSWGIMLNEGTNIREKMTNFWYHFIPVNFDDVRGSAQNSSVMCYQYMKLLRDNCLGNFKDLMKSIAKSPAMLIFLGNHYSTASTPNENFARELMELFTLGKAPTQNYTEDDVKAASRVLSGWKITTAFNTATPIASGFSSGNHNTVGPKVFSSFFAVPPATSVTIVNAAAVEFDTFFDMLFNPAANGQTVAKYICRRLYRYFVYYDIDANTEANIIAPLAATLISTWDILPVVKQLFKSEHFFDMANRGVMIKSPIDLLAGALRSLNIPTNGPAAITVANQYAVWANLHNKTNAIEQGYGLVPNVSGWKAYYQEPYFYQNWINTNTIQLRETMVKALLGITGTYTSGGVTAKIDFIATAQQFSNATIQDPNTLVNALVSVLLPVDLDTDVKFGTYVNSMLTVPGIKHRTLLSNQATDNYWTIAWNNYTTPPAGSSAGTIAGFKTTVTNKLLALFTELLELAEFQLM